MTHHQIVNHDEWIAACTRFLAKEKAWVKHCIAYGDAETAEGVLP